MYPSNTLYFFMLSRPKSSLQENIPLTVSGIEFVSVNVHCASSVCACVMKWWIIIVKVINSSVWEETCVPGVRLSWPALYPTLAGTWSWQVSGWVTGGHLGTVCFTQRSRDPPSKINTQQLESVFGIFIPFKCNISDLCRFYWHCHIYMILITILWYQMLFSLNPIQTQGCNLS